MAERILIDPVTRIEGHSKITIYLDDDGHWVPKADLDALVAYLASLK